MDQKLIDKYNIYAFDYIEYPHKSFWRPSSHKDYVLSLQRLFLSGEPTILYLHIPFCSQMCYFCLCHFRITHEYERIRRYLQHLKSEIEMHFDIGDEAGRFANIREVHLGGGSPTYMRESDFVDLKDELETLVDFDTLDEFTIEIDPRAVGRDRLSFYAENGVDRISFGVQDFDHDVQRAINRVQPPELIENLLSSPARKRFKSVNFDLLVGLPNQSVWTIGQTINRVIGMRPDRIALSYMHYNPTVHKHQLVMAKDGPLPDFIHRKEMHELASEMLCAAGYVRTGFEHFALPDDAVAKAVQVGEVQYNSLGATPGRAVNMLGLGVSSYGRVLDGYYQQTYDHAEYEQSIADMRFPIMRGWALTEEDKIRRDIIQALRSVFKVKLSEIERKYKHRLDFGREFELLLQMDADGMVEVRAWDEITITELGKNFTNVICRVFDNYVPRDDFWGAPKVQL